MPAGSTGEATLRSRDENETPGLDRNILERIVGEHMKEPLVAIITNHDDDIYCFRLELIQALLNQGYRLLISCPDGPKLDLMAQRYGLRKDRDFLYDDVKIDRRGTDPVRDWRLLRHYYRLLREHRPSVILTFTAKPNVYACFAAKKLHIPVISNVTGLGSVSHIRGLKRSLIMTLFRTAFRRSDYILFQNEDNLRFAQKHGFVNGPYRLIPGSGVALDRFPLQEYPEGGDGITGAPVIFNFIGRILREKGVDVYLKIAETIKEKYPNTEFNLIGFIEPTEAHYRETLAALEQRGIIVYRGQQDDVLPWIRRSHAVIHPSMYGEGMSNVLLENASCGRPIITTDTPGCRETVENGVSGFAVPVGDEADMIKTVETFIENTENDARKRMGLKGREKVESAFDRNTVVETYQQIICMIRGGKR